MPYRLWLPSVVYLYVVLGVLQSNFTSVASFFKVVVTVGLAVLTTAFLVCITILMAFGSMSMKLSSGSPIGYVYGTMMYALRSML